MRVYTTIVNNVNDAIIEWRGVWMENNSGTLIPFNSLSLCFQGSVTNIESLLWLIQSLIMKFPRLSLYGADQALRLSTVYGDVEQWQGGL